MDSSYPNKSQLDFKKKLLMVFGIFLFSISQNLALAQTQGVLKPQSIKLSAPFPVDQPSVEAMLTAHGATSAFVRAIRCWVPWNHRSSVAIATIDIFKDPSPPRKITLESGTLVEQSQFMVGLEQGFYPTGGSDNPQASWFLGLYPAEGQIAPPAKGSDDHTLSLSIRVNPLDTESDPKVTVKINNAKNSAEKHNPVTHALLEVKIKNGDTTTPVIVNLECFLQPSPSTPVGF